MNRPIPTIITVTIIALSLTSPAFSAETTIHRTCNGSGLGYTCTTMISHPPPPIPNPPAHGPVTSEEIIIPTKQTNTTEPLLSPRTDNFCGPGFRMTANGCEPH